MDAPKTMKAWQYGTVTGGLEKSLKLNASADIPTPKPNQHLVKVQYVCLNPVDYKPAESVARRFICPNPATPGIDFSGTIVKPARGSALKAGDRVFGCGVSPFAGGMLAQYAVTGDDATVHVPEGVSMIHASTIGVAGLTAYQSIVPYKPEKVFLNGGSGGVGIFGIQIAKAIGSEVTTTCSGRNVELCQGLGADEVIDYTKGDLADRLSGKRFDHAVDNIMADPRLYWKAHTYTTPEAKFITVGGTPSLKHLVENLKMRLWPGWLGGGKRKLQGFFAKSDVTDLTQIAKWMAEGKVKAVVDDEFQFSDVPKAFEKLKTGRARGKIVVQIGEDQK